MFTCTFHGWAYNTEGDLAGLPDAESLFGLERGKMGLVAVATAEWEGSILFCLDAQPRQTLAEYLGGLGEALAGYPFARSTTRALFICTIKSNWKNVVDSFCEIYHIPFCTSARGARLWQVLPIRSDT